LIFFAGVGRGPRTSLLDFGGDPDNDLDRGVWLTKNDVGSVLQKNCGFWFGFGFTKLTAVSVFLVRFFLHCVLFYVYDARNDILPC